VKGLLGSDVVGFQLPEDQVNFRTAVRELIASAHARGERFEVNGEPVVIDGAGARVGDRPVHVGAYPISINYKEYEDLGASEEAAETAERYRKDVGRNRKIILGIERLDYTKGIDLRLDAIELLLQQGRLNPNDWVYLQSMDKGSRIKIPTYAEFAEEVAEHIKALNRGYVSTDRFHPDTGRPYEPIFDLYDKVPPAEVPGAYLAADIYLVTPIKDDMNLMAKEYVAARGDRGGVLILSRGAGVCVQLGDNEYGALIVEDPNDPKEMARVIERAMTMPLEEQQARMAWMQQRVRSHQVNDWSESFLADLREARANRVTQQPAGGGPSGRRGRPGAARGGRARDTGDRGRKGPGR
jgi:trehalose 6-phosphate synthase